MDNKTRKIYDKALDFYEKGEINRALDLCEIALAEDLRQSEILNFKGLMLYQRGMLKEAVTVWKLNLDINKDAMAKSYIKDSERDEERIKLYKEAEKLLKKSDVNSALKLFLECAKSDFNCIKVNTGIAWCYQKKGDYYRAKGYIDKALKVDKNAVTANEIKKQLEGMDLYYGESKSGKGKGIIIFALIVILSVGGYFFWKNYLPKIIKNQADNSVVVEDENVENDVDIEENKVENIEEKQEEVIVPEDKTVSKFDSEALKTAINNSDYNLIYDQIYKVKTDDLTNDEKRLYNKAVSLLKNNGVSNFYENGLAYYNQKDYVNAEDQLCKAYEYCEESDLDEHIIFYRGSTASEHGNRELALQMYEKYNELYSDGPYIEGVLYELALITEESDREKAKVYAEKLVNNYPQSLYINDRINQILN